MLPTADACLRLLQRLSTITHTNTHTQRWWPCLINTLVISALRACACKLSHFEFIFVIIFSTPNWRAVKECLHCGCCCCCYYYCLALYVLSTFRQFAIASALHGAFICTALVASKYILCMCMCVKVCVFALFH